MAEKKFYGDGVVTGYGKIEGRLVYVFPRISRSSGERWAWPFAQKICKVMGPRHEVGAPVIA